MIWLAEIILVKAILSLVPAGLTPVAVFPPFLTPRRVFAEAVIYKESEGTLPGIVKWFVENLKLVIPSFTE